MVIIFRLHQKEFLIQIVTIMGKKEKSVLDIVSGWDKDVRRGRVQPKEVRDVERDIAFKQAEEAINAAEKALNATDKEYKDDVDDTQKAINESIQPALNEQKVDNALNSITTLNNRKNAPDINTYRYSPNGDEHQMPQTPPTAKEVKAIGNLMAAAEQVQEVANEEPQDGTTPTLPLQQAAQPQQSTPLQMASTTQPQQVQQQEPIQEVVANAQQQAQQTQQTQQVQQAPQATQEPQQQNKVTIKDIRSNEDIELELTPDGKFKLGNNDYTADQLISMGYQLPEQYYNPDATINNSNDDYYTTTTSQSYEMREPTEAERDIFQKEDEEAQRRYGVVVDENGNVRAKDTFLTDILGIDPDKIKEEDERKLRQANMRRKSANLFQSLMLLNDIVGGFMGGIIQKRDANTKAKDAADNIDKINDDIIKREQEWKEKEAKAVDNYLEWKQARQKERNNLLKVSKNTQTSNRDLLRHNQRMAEISEQNAGKVQAAQIRAAKSSSVASSSAGSDTYNYIINFDGTEQTRSAKKSHAQYLGNTSAGIYQGILNRLRNERMQALRAGNNNRNDAGFIEATEKLNTYIAFIEGSGLGQIAKYQNDSGVYPDKWGTWENFLNQLIPYEILEDLTESEVAAFRNLYNLSSQYNKKKDTQQQDDSWQGVQQNDEEFNFD